MNRKTTATIILGVFLTSTLSGCSSGPQVFGGKCDEVLTKIDKVNNLVSPNYNSMYPDLLDSVNIYDDMELGSVIGADHYNDSVEQVGSEANVELYQNWTRAIGMMLQYSYASGMKQDFFSSDMGPFYLKDGYGSFLSSSEEITAVCKAKVL